MSITKADPTKCASRRRKFVICCSVVGRSVPGRRPAQPISAYSSLRPLVRDEAASATKTSREHRIWADEQGMVHVTGGKYTTYRLMSEEAADCD